MSGVRDTFGGELGSSNIAWGLGWSVVLFVLGMWWATSVFRKENA
ncbi:hypothetical protein [Metallococcus carri]|nr:hypothetical protein [Metallococcus carri]